MKCSNIVPVVSFFLSLSNVGVLSYSFVSVVIFSCLARQSLLCGVIAIKPYDQITHKSVSLCLCTPRRFYQNRMWLHGVQEVNGFFLCNRFSISLQPFWFPEGASKGMQ